ncbi:phenylalanine--tRNA ligase subunit beta [Quadrisphaera oryzae]|uniref:phenylalanine--tRNA ligase subunit beta n=1 Tax=Quadrisphaera TaxID=317661 RepID=UPI00164503D6|nr:phenylalanine--tRNA ligase subunit beta [Quadrisphaera sp. RL12-1S]MBC3763701.1 phenylalanine--tRNA ligase subunit beta [Quadrisphaera sp. RL12-1S]
MRAPLSWIRQWVDLPADATGEQVAAALVRVGLEEEGLHGGDVTGPVVVGRVLSLAPEPQKNGKTINWCSVDTGELARGEEPRGVVCGAHNFSAGDLVVVATPGAVLPGPFPIAARKTYGHVSDGMICSARELGLGEDHDGIIVLSRLLGDSAASQLQPGQDALALLGLTEEVVEVNVTPDRGYCFSVRGLAREYAHGAGLDVATAFRDPADVEVPAAGGSGSAAGHGVELRDDAPVHGAPGCTRLVARVVRGVDPTAPSPFWLQRRLQQAGMRPISLAVDVTNHVMLELGQPLHAYDLAAVDGPLVVRRARPGERLVTLDGVDRTLDPEDLLITDGPDGQRAIGLAGVMGGRDTEVTTTTRDVLVEAARFDPVSIARTARRHKLPSEASRRFERGVDTALQAAAAELAVRLLVEHGGGVADDAATDVVAAGAAVEPAAIALPVGLPSRLSGVPAEQLDAARVTELLEQVGCVVSSGSTGVLAVVPPTWRPDLVQPVDLVEEVVRLHGYEAVPSELPPAPPGRGLTSGQRLRRRAADALAAGGFVEVRSYPFTSAARSDELGLPADDPRRAALRLANPLSDEQPLLRTSVLATLLDVLRRNTSRGAADVALFEVGGVVNPVAGARAAGRLRVDRRPSDAELAGLLAAVPPQPVHVAGVLAGRAEPDGWWGAGRVADAADAVAAAQLVAQALRVELAVSAGALAPWHPGRCAQLSLPASGGAAGGTAGAVVGHAGELHPAVVAALGLPARTVAFELDLDALVVAAPELVPAPRLSPFPPSKEDVALVVDASVPAEDVRQALLAGAAGSGHADLVEEVRLFDVYTGAPVPEGHRSLAFSLRLRALDRTLTAADAAAVREAAVAEAARRHGAVLRGA